MARTSHPIFLLAILTWGPWAAGCVGSNPSGPPSVVVTQLEPGFGSAMVAFHATTSTSQSVVVRDENGEEVYRKSLEGDGPRSVLVGFLEPNRSYQLRIDAFGTRRASMVLEQTFTTSGGRYQWADPAQVQLQPGALILGGDCTAGFILRDETNASLYVMTARHCVQDVGQEVPSDEGVPIGRVVALGTYDLDWALVKIREDFRPNVTAAVRYWSGPSRLLTRDAFQPGDLVCLGKPPRPNSTGPSRCGRYLEYMEVTQLGKTARMITLQLDVEPGDSGSPVLHRETGGAVGMIVTREPFGRQTTAMLVESVLELASMEGFVLRVATFGHGRPSG